MERERERRIDCVGPAFPFLSLLLSPWPPDLPSASFSSFFTSSRLCSFLPLPSHSFLLLSLSPAIHSSASLRRISLSPSPSPRIPTEFGPNASLPHPPPPLLRIPVLRLWDAACELPSPSPSLPRTLPSQWAIPKGSRWPPPMSVRPLVRCAVARRMLMSPVNLNHFRLLRVVGKGAFGKVRIVERKDTGLTFALKYIRKEEGRLHPSCVGRYSR